MAKKPISEKYRQNHLDIEDAFESLRKSLLEEIKESNEQNIKTYTRLLTFLLGTYAETFLTYFIYETHYKKQEPYFSEEIIKNILNLGDQNKRWEYIIKVSMEKKLNKDYSKLDRVEVLVYDDILNTFKTHITPIILLRNKIAHGNWTYIIHGSDEEIYNGLTTKTALHQENYLSLKFKTKLLSRLKELLFAMNSSEQTIFEDYNNAYEKINPLSIDIKNMDFKNFNIWKKKQQESYNNARIHKEKNTKVE